MIRSKITLNNNVDDNLIKIINNVKRNIIKKDDDAVYLIVGSTGVGKSNLALHMQELYMGEKSSVENVALNRSSFADAIHRVAQEPMPRALLYDESNINKRESGTKFNREIIDLFMAIRGMNIFHVWCSPSLDQVDKFFIKEKIKGVFLCVGKTPNVRTYYFFKMSSILYLLSKHKNLTLPILSKYAYKYAYYQGFYKEYIGELKKAYLSKKHERMMEKIVHFRNLFSDEKDKSISGLQLRKMLQVHRNTFKTYFYELIKANKIKENEDFRRVGSNRLVFDKKVLPLFVDLQQRKSRNTANNIIKINKSISSNMGDHEINEQKQSN
jgi:phage anti-repressor protein